MENEDLKADVQVCTELEEEDDLQLNFVRMYLGVAQKGWTPLSFNMGKAILSRWKKENKEAGKNWKFFSYTDPTKLKTSIVKVQVGVLEEGQVKNPNDGVIQMLCEKGKGVSHETNFIGNIFEPDKNFKRGGADEVDSLKK